jgi:hypothetical protein
MLAQTWLSMFQHIPPEHQSRFTLVTINGTEISIQCFLRLEPEFAIIKGRLAGSQDSGRVFFIPYASIDTFSFTNPTKESEVAELFDSWTCPAAPLASVAPVTTRPASLQGGIEPALEMIAPMVPVSPSTRTPLPATLSEQGSAVRPVLRSEVLERFRNRPSSSHNLPRPNEG